MRGIEIFKEYFHEFQGNYVFIGGTACTILFEEAGEAFRATKDMDIVLIIENINVDFAKQFWRFIHDGQYEEIFASEVHGRFYRFAKPVNSRFPYMIELFSRRPAEFALFPGTHLMPIHIADDVSSLSAILLDDDYYRFLLDGRKLIDGIPVLDELHLIAFKAKAWCELTDRHQKGEEGLTRHIKKHRKDIAMLMSLVGSGVHASMDGIVMSDMKRFIDAMRSETLDVYTTGVAGMTTKRFVETLESFFQKNEG
jgi:hypothetical protein